MLIDALGYLAAGAVLATFSVHCIKSLRMLAIISNLLFIAYATSASLLPVLVLHALLLPLNLWRLREVLDGNRQAADQLRSKIKPLNDDRRHHADRRAYCDQATHHTPPPQLIKQRVDQHRAGGSNRVT